jgi:hypothetical protein
MYLSAESLLFNGRAEYVGANGKATAKNRLDAP